MLLLFWMDVQVLETELLARLITRPKCPSQKGVHLLQETTSVHTPDQVRLDANEESHAYAFGGRLVNRTGILSCCLTLQQSKRLCIMDDCTYKSNQGM